MSVRDLIAAAFNKDAAAFEETLQLVMQEKMGEAIQARFSPAMYEEEVDLEEAKSDEDEEDEDEDEDDMCEDVDQIDEISDAMKSRYVSAAKKDLTAKFTKPLAPEHKTATGKAKKSWLNSPERAELNRKMGQRADIVKKLTKEEAEQIDEISGAKIGTYLIKARKSEAELDKKRDASYDDEDTPENKVYRKKLTTAMNKRRWGQGKAMDKLTGSSFAKVPATEK